MKSPCQTSLTGLVMSWALHLAGVSLWPGSESSSPMILQVTRTSATTQKMKQLVPYMIIAGRLTTEPAHHIIIFRNACGQLSKFARLQNFRNQWKGHQRICFLLFWVILLPIDGKLMICANFGTKNSFSDNHSLMPQATGLLLIILCHEQTSSTQTHLVYQTC